VGTGRLSKLAVFAEEHPVDRLAASALDERESVVSRVKRRPKTRPACSAHHDLIGGASRLSAGRAGSAFATGCPCGFPLPSSFGNTVAFTGLQLESAATVWVEYPPLARQRNLRMQAVVSGCPWGRNAARGVRCRDQCTGPVVDLGFVHVGVFAAANSTANRL